MKSAANTKGLKENLSKEFVKEFDDYFKEKNDIMTVDDVVHLVNDAALSKNQVLTILRTISNKFPNLQLTTPRIKEALEKRKLLFEDFFTTEFMDFLDKNGKPLNRAVTWCNDIEGFIEYNAVLEGKDWTNYKNVIGIDYGKGSIKIVLTLHDEKKMKDETNMQKNSMQSSHLRGLSTG